MNTFGDMKKCFIFFGGSLQNWTILGVIFIYFRGFFKVKIQNGNIFGVAKFQIFLGCLIFLIFSGINSRCWVQAYV